MTQYLVQPGGRIFVKSYVFLFYAESMAKSIGKI